MIEKLKEKFIASLYSIDTAEHVLPLHFVSEETAELRRNLDDTTSSTFLAPITWKVIRKEIAKWVKDEKSSEWFQRNILDKSGEWVNASVVFGPYKVPIGVKYPNFGAKQSCNCFVVKVIAHRYVDYFGKECIDIRVKTVHPEVRKKGA